MAATLNWTALMMLPGFCLTKGPACHGWRGCVCVSGEGEGVTVICSTLRAQNVCVCKSYLMTRTCCALKTGRYGYWHASTCPACYSFNYFCLLLYNGIWLTDTKQSIHLIWNHKAIRSRPVLKNGGKRAEEYAAGGDTSQNKRVKWQWIYFEKWI